MRDWAVPWWGYRDCRGLIVEYLVSDQQEPLDQFVCAVCGGMLAGWIGWLLLVDRYPAVSRDEGGGCVGVALARLWFERHCGVYGVVFAGEVADLHYVFLDHWAEWQADDCVGLDLRESLCSWPLD